MKEVIPTIIAKTPEEFREMLKRLEPHVGRVSLDVMDGIFVPNQTISGHRELQSTQTPLEFDIHLMVANPEQQIDDWLQTKADRIFIHIESQDDLSGTVKKVKNSGRKVGLALNLETSTDKLAEYLSIIDYVQFMTVKPGFYGSMFIEDVVRKISDFHMNYPQIPLAVDGGITPETANKASAAGASIFYVGSFIQKSQNIQAALKAIQNVL